MENIVSYELAIKLKEIGFNVDTIFGYDNSKRLRGKLSHTNSGSIISWDIHDEHIKAPLYQEVIEWLETKDIFLSRVYYNDKITPARWIYHLSNKELDNHYVGSDYEKAIEETIKLIC